MPTLASQDPIGFVVEALYAATVPRQNAPPSSQPLDPAFAAENNLPRILGVTGTFHALAIIVVALRLYARIGVLKTPSRDDYVMLASALCAMGGMICFILQGYHGLGRHTKSIKPPDLKTCEQIAFFQGIISAVGALGLLKISIAFSLLRLSKERRYSYSLWGLIAFVVVYTLIAWLSFLVRCQPMEGWWDRTVKAKCYPIENFIKFGLANTAFNTFTDICFASLPIPIIWELQLKKRIRLYLIGALSLGYLAVCMGIVKAVYQIGFGKNPDKHFDQSIQFWGFLQLNVGIIAACAPTLRPLVSKRLKLSSYGQQYNAYNNIDRSGQRSNPIQSKQRNNNGELVTIGGGKDQGRRATTTPDSDEYELHHLGRDDDTKRIVRTTEVRVE